MNKRASFIVAMTIVLVSLPACARQERQRQQAQASQTWTQEPTYGSEDYRLEAQRQEAGQDVTSRVATEEQEQRQRAQGMAESESEDLESLAAETGDELAQRAAEACPMNVEGAEVKSREVPNGVALVFTSDANVEELRTAVDRFAQLHNEQSAAPMPETGRESYGAEPGAQPEHGMEHGAVASRAEVEEIDRGAQIILTPRDPSQLSSLRQEAQRDAQRMQGGECPTFGGEPSPESPATGG